MENNQEQSIISYLEGEIKYDEETSTIMIKNVVFIDFWDLSENMDKSIIDDLGKFTATALINERERRKEQYKAEPEFEYEMLFKSKEGDFVKIDGWYPIATDRISNPKNISKYIENGILRRITPKKEEDNDRIRVI